MICGLMKYLVHDFWSSETSPEILEKLKNLFGIDSAWKLFKKIKVLDHSFGKGQKNIKKYYSKHWEVLARRSVKSFLNFVQKILKIFVIYLIYYKMLGKFGYLSHRYRKSIHKNLFSQKVLSKGLKVSDFSQDVLERC